jgi:hypothetical protein
MKPQLAVMGKQKGNLKSLISSRDEMRCAKPAGGANFVLL